MTLENIEQQSPPQGRELAQALKELQGLTFTLVAGAAADADIAIAGFSWDNDTVKAVLFFDKSGPDLLDLTAELQEGSVDGAIQLSTTATNGAGDKLLVAWFNKGAL